MCEPGLLEILSGQDELTGCTAVTSEASDSDSHICFQRGISTCEPGLLEILSGQDELFVLL
jgi:hypothetical protein